MNRPMPDVAQYAFDDIRSELRSMPMDDTVHDLFEVLMCDVRIYWALSRHKDMMLHTDTSEPEQVKRLVIQDLDDLQMTERRARADIEALCERMPPSDATRRLMAASKNVTATSELLGQERKNIEANLRRALLQRGDTSQCP